MKLLTKIFDEEPNGFCVLEKEDIESESMQMSIHDLRTAIEGFSEMNFMEVSISRVKPKSIVDFNGNSVKIPLKEMLVVRPSRKGLVMDSPYCVIQTDKISQEDNIHGN